MNRHVVVLTSALALGIIAWVGAQEALPFKMVVHPGNLVEDMSANEISNLFLKKTSAFRDGTMAAPVNLTADSPIREKFATVVHGRSSSSVESYMNQQVFSGRAKPPLVLASDADVMDFVSRTRGGIGYVSAGTELVGVGTFDILTEPERLSYVEPKYTVAARKARLRGEVVLEVHIDAEGEVSDTVPIKKLGMGLTAEAEKAVKKWKYKPATRSGLPTPATITVSVNF